MQRSGACQPSDIQSFSHVYPRTFFVTKRHLSLPFIISGQIIVNITIYYALFTRIFSSRSQSRSCNYHIYPFIELSLNFCCAFTKTIVKTDAFSIKVYHTRRSFVNFVSLSFDVTIKPSGCASDAQNRRLLGSHAQVGCGFDHPKPSVHAKVSI